MKRHLFMGRAYRILPNKRKDILGETAPPDERSKFMKIPVSGHDRICLETILHESLHACFFVLDEDAVEKAAESMARFLWRLGWRKLKKGGKGWLKRRV